MFSGFIFGAGDAEAAAGGFVPLFHGLPGRSNISGPYATFTHPCRQPASTDFQPLLYRMIFSRPPSP
jgi:hypothetical protein